MLPRMNEMLTPEQRARLEQIRLQAGGLVVFRIAKEKLGLTDQQNEVVRSSADEFRAASQLSPAIAFDPRRSRADQAAIEREYLDRYWAAHRKMVEQASGQLSDDQRRRLDELLGPRLDARTLFEQMEKAALTVVRPQLTVQIYDNGSIGVYQSNGTVTPVRR
jgi:hypothetical protein